MHMLRMQERLAYNFGKEIRRGKQYYYAEHYAHYFFRLYVARGIHEPVYEARARACDNGKHAVAHGEDYEQEHAVKHAGAVGNDCKHGNKHGRCAVRRKRASKQPRHERCTIALVRLCLYGGFGYQFKHAEHLQRHGNEQQRKPQVQPRPKPVEKIAEQRRREPKRREGEHGAERERQRKAERLLRLVLVKPAHAAEYQRNC